jgi:hypothetical protein
MYTTSNPRPVASLSLILAGWCTALALCADQPVIRWATSVIGVSSQYSSPAYGAVQALGEPNVFPNHSDNAKAWASASANGQREFLALGYADPIRAAGVVIYETFNPGAVDRVEVRNADTEQWVEVWTGAAVAQPKEARVFMVSFPQTTFLVDGVRIELDSPAVSGWNEIDAVALLDRDPATAGPVVGAFDVTLSGGRELYTELAAETLTGRVWLTDRFHGVASAAFQLLDPSGAAIGQPSAASRVDVFGSSIYRDQWTGSVIIPQGSPTGDYGVRIHATSLAGGVSTVDQFGLFTVTDTLPRPGRSYRWTKVIEVGDVGHSFAGRQFTVQDFGVFLPPNPLVNRLGEIAFSARLRDQNQVFASATYLQSGEMRRVLVNSQITGFSGTANSLNDAGWVAFIGSETGGTIPQGIYKSNGEETVLIDDTPDTDFPRINNAGQVAYLRGKQDTFGYDLWRGDGSSKTLLVESRAKFPTPPGSVISGEQPELENLVMGDIADDGTVYFGAAMRSFDQSNTIYSAIGRARFEGFSLLSRAAPRSGTFYTAVGGWATPHYTEALAGSPKGKLAFVGYVDPVGNFALPPPQVGISFILRPTSFIAAGPGSHYDSSLSEDGSLRGLSVNDRGVSVYIQGKSNTRQWLKVTSLPRYQRTILRSDHYLDGRRVEQMQTSHQAIDPRGRVVVLVRFTDGHEAIYRADPVTGEEASLPEFPDEESALPPNGLVRYHFENAASASWLALPPRGEVTLSVLTGGGRVRELLAISAGLVRPVEVVVNDQVVGQWHPGESFDLVARTGASSAVVTLRNLAVNEGFTGSLAILPIFNNPTVELEVDGAAVPLLRQPNLRAALPGELLSLPATAVDDPGFTYQWRKAGVVLTDDDRQWGGASDTLGVYPFEPADAGEYELTATGAAGGASVTVEVFNALTFGNWLAQFFPEAGDDPALLDPSATPQEDGVPNIVKYAFGIDPTRPMTAGEKDRFARVSRVIPGAENHVEISVTLNPAATEAGLAVFASADAGAGSWEQVPAEELVVIETSGPEGRTLTVRLPPATDATQFYQIQLAYQPR